MIAIIYSYLIYLFCNCSAYAYVLVSHSETSIEDYDAFLKKNSESISYINFIETEKGLLSQEMLQLLEEKNIKSHDKEFIAYSVDLLTSGFLNTLKKNILLKSLNNYKLSSISETNEFERYFKVDLSFQITSLREGVIKNPGTRPSPLRIFRDDDRIYINGIRIPNDQLQFVTFHSNLYYHIAYISNAYRPSFQWAMGDQIKELKKENLITGDCKYLAWEKNISETVLGAQGLYLASCNNFLSNSNNREDLKLSSSLSSNSVLSLPFTVSSSNVNEELIKNERQPYWTIHPVLTVVGSLIFFNLIKNEIKKNLNTNIEIRFSY